MGPDLALRKGPLAKNAKNLPGPLTEAGSVAYASGMTRHLGSLAMLLFAASACSGGEDDGGAGGSGGGGGAACGGQAETFVAGMQKDGKNGKLAFTLADSVPAPPGLSDNVWTLELADAGGAPVEGAAITASPWMVEHGHPSPRQVQVTESGGGAYVLDPVNFNMVGLWEITIQATPPGGDEDEVVFAFCIGE